jgi:DNA-binding response OmpR family regulator
MQIKGFYIEDDLSNIESYGRFFEDEGIQIIYEEILLPSPDDYYDLLCKVDADFVIIDNHLEKQGVKYDGFDVLRSIRKHDATIYILLLTNFSYNDKTSNELGEFDQTIKKDLFLDQFEEIITRVKRAVHRKKTDNYMNVVEQSLDINNKTMDAQLKELKDIRNVLDKLSDNK